MAELKPVSTPMSMETSLDLDENGESIDQREYRSMIDSLLYFTTTQPDIQFSMLSNILWSLGFGILLLLRWILLVFLMLILWVVRLTKRTLLILIIFWIFSYLLVFSKIIFSWSIHHRG
jgi:hypothetical protein